MALMEQNAGEIGKIRNSREKWKEICIRDICESIIDCVNKTAPVVDYTTEYKMIRTSNVRNGRIDLSDVKFVTKEVFNFWTRRMIPEKGDIILTREAPLGEVGMITTDDHIFLGQRLMQYRANSRYLDDRFLLYAFQEHSFQEQIKLLGSGATVEHMKVPEAEKLMLWLPPLPEQHAIAIALSDTDALITSLDQLIAKKRDIKQATMQRLLTGKRRLPGFSEEWKVKNIGEIAPLQRGFDLPTSQLKEGIYPVVYSNGVLNHHSSFRVRAPGVVTGRSGTIGKVNYIEDDYWPHNTSLWVTDFKGNLPKFIYYMYINIKLEQFGTGSGVPTMNRNDVHTYQISIPPFREQQAIATVLSDMDDEIAVLEQKREKTHMLKQGMMQELLTGKTRLL